VTGDRRDGRWWRCRYLETDSRNQSNRCLLCGIESDFDHQDQEHVSWLLNSNVETDKDCERIEGIDPIGEMGDRGEMNRNAGAGLAAAGIENEKKPTIITCRSQDR